MVQWFGEGGFAMWPVLVVGLLSWPVAMRYAASAGSGWRQAARTLQGAAVTLGLAGTGIGATETLRYAAHAGESMLPVIAAKGISEALGPAVLAGLLCAVGALFVAAGDLRDDAAPRPR